MPSKKIGYARFNTATGRYCEKHTHPDEIEECLDKNCKPLVGGGFLNMVELSTYPDAAIRSEAQRRNQAKRKVKSGGRNGGPKKLADRKPKDPK